MDGTAGKAGPPPVLRRWTIKEVDGGMAPNATGDPLSFDFTPTGDPQVAYTAAFELPHQYKFASRGSDGKTWSVEVFDTYQDRYGTFFAGVSLATDRQGRPHVAYTKDFANTTDQWGQLLYAVKQSDKWSIMHVDDSDHAEWASLVLDATSMPHIAFYAGAPARDLRYATRTTNGTWTVTTVDNGWSGYYPALAVDSHGFPHIAYFTEASPVPFSAKYASFDGKVWTSTLLPFHSPVGYGMSLALDAQNEPHLAFTNNTFNQSLYYARRTGTEWTLETVADACRASGTSLALDTNGNPHITYTFSTSDASGPGDHRYADTLS